MNSKNKSKKNEPERLIRLMSYRFDTGDLFARNTCLLSSNDIRDVNYDRDRDWDLYELLDSTFCRGRESVEGKK